MKCAHHRALHPCDTVPSVAATSGDGRTKLGLALLSRTPRNTCSVKKVGVSSIFLKRRVRPMFMRVNSRCAHHRDRIDGSTALGYTLADITGGIATRATPVAEAVTAVSTEFESLLSTHKESPVFSATCGVG
jgi:hypothetical protein